MDLPQLYTGDTQHGLTSYPNFQVEGNGLIFRSAVIIPKKGRDNGPLVAL